MKVTMIKIKHHQLKNVLMKLEHKKIYHKKSKKHLTRGKLI